MHIKNIRHNTTAPVCPLGRIGCNKKRTP